MDLTDLETEGTVQWSLESATGRLSGTGCSVGVLMVCCVRADIAHKLPETERNVNQEVLFKSRKMFVKQRRRKRHSRFLKY